MSRQTQLVLAVVLVLAPMLTLVGTALADDPHSGGGTGQPSQSCQNPATSTTPGNAVNSPGSPFNSNGVSGGVYNPGSQYDVACFQNSQPHP